MPSQLIAVVFEANEHYLRGLLEGFQSGRKTAFKYFFNRDAGIQAESLSEKIKEWTSLSDKYQHLLMEQDLFDMVKKFGADQLTEQIKILSARPVQSGKFSVKVKNAARGETDIIKQTFAAKPAAVQTLDWHEEEKEDRKAKGIELYTPAHEYLYEASGAFQGELEALIAFRQKVAAFSAVDAKEIELEFISSPTMEKA
ncbi:MAG TPA: hypothetical protein PK843_18665 [bacterium]|nr:hypothetical protein [bacterium]